MAHYKVILAYDGTAFAGFQRQSTGRTIQGAFEDSLRQIGWQGRGIWAAGRTDAGVHGRGQVVSFDLDWRHGCQDLRNALNHYLPPDIAAREVHEAPSDFQPRFDAASRRYRYYIFCQPVRDPLRERYAWRVWPQVDLERMNTAARDLIGSYDFKAFGRAMKKGGVTIREVFSAVWSASPDGFCFDIEANAFLYHMVRRIVLALVEIGQEKADVSLIRQSLRSGELPLTGLAPAAGLVLEEVCY